MMLCRFLDYLYAASPLQVERAVSRARNRWLQEMSSLPEYKASLQTEREQWETQHQQHIHEQVC